MQDSMKPKRNSHTLAWLITILVIAALILLLIMRLGSHKKPQGPVVVVEAANAVIQPMPVIYQSPGNIEATQSISITSQITGILRRINFVPGQKVIKGQVLFEIDSAPLIAQVQQVQANLKKDQATLRQLQADATRYSALAKKEYVTRQQAEQAQTQVNAQLQAVQADEALIKQAQIQLSYARIISPVTGIAGNLTARIGDLIVANSAQPIITINQLTPTWVDFYVPQYLLPAIQKSQLQKSLVVKILSDDGNTLLDTGKLVFIDNTVNSQTGTVLLKAQADNVAGRLWPGQIVTTQLVISIQPRAITIPVDGVQIDQNGNFVYVVVNGKAYVRRVKVDRQIGNLAVVTSGLHGNELIVTRVPPNFIEGTQLKISNR